MAERVRSGPAFLTGLGDRARTVRTGTWLVLLVAGALVVAVLVGLVAGNRPAGISSQLVGLDTHNKDAGRITMTYRVTKPPRDVVACMLTATARDFAVVGTVTDTVGVRTDGGRSTTRTVSIRTSRLAVSAAVASCRVTERR